MTTLLRHVLRIVALITVLVLVCDRVDRVGQRTWDRESAASGKAAPEFIVQAAKGDLCRAQAPAPRGLSGFFPVPWRRRESGIRHSEAARAPEEAHRPMPVRVSRRIPRMDSDEPPPSTAAELAGG
jgi:hypothetical protein